MTNESPKVSLFEEPLLEFNYDQKLQDPHNGLALFGPVDANESSHPKSIIYGVIGTTEGIAKFREWNKILNKPVIPQAQNSKEPDRRLWPPFPGYEAVYLCQWPEKPVWEAIIDENDILNKSRINDPHKRAYEVVDCYLQPIKTIKKKDEHFDVLICIVPEDVWLNCRPESHVSDSWGVLIPKKTRTMFAKGQTSLGTEINPQQYQLSVDFRQQIKARSMEYDIPIQIIRETTLVIDPDTEQHRRVTQISDRAWNLSSTLYYKAGGKPWRLANAREGVCYIGTSFRRTSKDKDGTTACCAAQMFLDSGDGMVFLGEYGPWYSVTNKQYHLSKESAHNLIKSVLESYKGLRGKELKEVFLHSRSEISLEEFEGYQQACPTGTKVVGIRVHLEKGVKLFREGTRPVMRGTYLQLNDRSALLWASGFKPQIGTYDGWDVPNPLRIDIQHGDADIKQVSKDIFGLTKLNYNACKLGDSEPITIKFSDAVGEILVSNRNIKSIKHNFKYYI